MAWEHFTDWLQPGESITAAQYGELLDAIEERMIALCAPDQFGWVGDPAERTGMYAIRDSGVITNRALYRLFGSDYDDALEYAVFDMASAWIVDGTEPIGWGADTLFSTAATDLGLAIEEADLVFFAAYEVQISDHRYWNMLRRMVQLFQIAHAPVVPIAIEKYFANSGPIEDDDFLDDTRDGFLSASEDVTTWGDAWSFFRFEYYPAASIRGVRTTSTLAVPDHPMFASYDAWLWVYAVKSLGGRAGTGSITMTASFDGVPASISDLEGPPIESWHKFIFGSALSVTGSIPVLAELDAYSDGSQVEEFYPAEPGAVELLISIGWLARCGVCLKPGFTHPYEEME